MILFDSGVLWDFSKLDDITYKKYFLTQAETILTEDADHVSIISVIQCVYQENIQLYLHHGDQINYVVCLVES